MNLYRFKDGLNSDICLPEKERRRIVRRSLEKDPWRTKCTIVMEELAELQQQISKKIRGYHNELGLLEELADVYICLGYLESIFNIDKEELQKAIDVKLLREKERMEGR